MGGGGGTGGGGIFGPDYSSPPSDVAPGGGNPTFMSKFGSGMSSFGKSNQNWGQTPIPPWQSQGGLQTGVDPGIEQLLSEFMQRMSQSGGGF